MSQQLSQAKKVLGRPRRLSVVDQRLLMLEYRTYFHIAQSYQVSEAPAFPLITRAENHLIKSGEFRLPAKKALLESCPYEGVMVDVTETKIERPKKTTPLVLFQKETASFKAATRGGQEKWSTPLQALR